MSQHHEGTFTSFDGLTIYHQSWLPEGNPTSVIMLVHGLGEHSGRYAHVADRLTAAGHAVHALDLRGHGKSSGKRTFVKNYGEFMSDLVQFRALVESEHPGTPLVVLGHSMGGNLAMGHVLDHQDGVAGLVLSGALLKTDDQLSSTQMKIYSLVAKVAPGMRPRGIDTNAISRDPEVVAAYHADPLVFTGKISAGLGAALFGAIDSFPSRYPSLTLPILVMHGTADRLTSIAGSKALAAGATNATVTSHFYEGLYHEIFNEPEQQQVLDDLISWLATTIA
jgi:acylglycerol lipase